MKPQMFVAADAVVAAFRDAPRIDFQRLRKDLDRFVHQDATPGDGQSNAQGESRNPHRPRE